MNSADIPSDQSASARSDSADTIRAYLLRLELALDGSDAALRHDALVDAEEHLRSAIAAGTSPSQAIAEYGTPEEIAAAYETTATSGSATTEAPAALASGTSSSSFSEATSGSPSSSPPSAGESPSRKRKLRDIPIVGIWFHPVAWRALAYFGIVSFPLATAYFVWTVTVGSLAIGTVPTIIGIPLIVFLLGSARALSLFEGKIVEFFLGVRMPRRTQPVAGVMDDGVVRVGFWRRIWCWLRDVRSWMSLGYLIGNFPVSVAAFVVTFTLSLVSVVLIALPVIDFFGYPMGHTDHTDEVEIQFFFSEVKPDAAGDLWLPTGAAIPSFLAGLVLLTATLWLVRGMGWVYGHVVQAIQVARPRPSSASRFDPPPDARTS